MKMRFKTCLAALLVAAWLPTAAQADAAESLRAHYLANAGVMVARGDTKVLFDPFFRNDYGQYELVPAEMEAAIFAGLPPWDGVDAIFISHLHDDHFDAATIARYLQQWPEVRLYAPQQAVDAMPALPALAGQGFMHRVHGLLLRHDSEPARIEMHGLQIEAVHLAHAGWPDRHADVDNIVFRVTLDDAVSVMHLGDADAARELYAGHTSFWGERTTRLALVPVWLMLTQKGRSSLDTFVQADHEIGMHVYRRVPDEPADRAPEFQGLDIFTEPGEIREFE